MLEKLLFFQNESQIFSHSKNGMRAENRLRIIELISYVNLAASYTPVWIILLRLQDSGMKNPPMWAF